MIRKRLVARRLSWLAAVALAVPVLALSASTGVAAPPSELPPGLRPTEVNVTNDLSTRWGEPQIAVNPKNPNNIVYFVMTNDATYQCQATDPLNCAPANFINGQPRGFYAIPGFYDSRLFVTFDRGRTWEEVEYPSVPVPRGFPGEGNDHPNLLSRPDPMVTVDADGTFYIGWDANHMDVNLPPFFFVSGGIAVSKSSDGGRTWSTPVLTGTGIDRPFLVTDLSTGTVYESSSGFVDSAASTANPLLPILVPGQPRDRWLVSAPDGVQWTTPQRFGGGTFGASQAMMSAAHGLIAASFNSADNAACTFFVSTSAPCVVFQTSSDSGATWTRRPVPTLAGTTRPMIAADPVDPGTFAIAAFGPGATSLVVSMTQDSGLTWSTPVTLTDDAVTQKFKAAMAYSPDGDLALVWRSRTLPGSSVATPYHVFAAASDDDGATWSDPLRVTSQASPGADPAFVAGGLDDLSYVAVSHQNVFVAWGDWRPGDVQGFFSAIKLQAFDR